MYASRCETKIFFANSLLRIVKFEISHANANAKNSHLFAKYANYSHIFAKLYIFVYNWVIFVYNFVLYCNNFANKCEFYANIHYWHANAKFCIYAYFAQFKKMLRNFAHPSLFVRKNFPYTYLVKFKFFSTKVIIFYS